MRRPVTDQEVYPALWIALAAAPIACLFWRFALKSPPLGECRLYRSFHVYCPGCGGTRAVIALLHGQVLRSAYYHPAVLLAAGFVLAYLLSQTVWRLRGRRGFVLHYTDRWATGLLAVLLLNCALRNLLWFGFQIPL